MIKSASEGKIGDITVQHIKVESEHVILRQKLSEKLEYKAFEEIKCRISFVGPYIKGYFNIETDSFLLKDCHVYQYVNGKNRGYCDLCDKKR